MFVPDAGPRELSSENPAGSVPRVTLGSAHKQGVLSPDSMREAVGTRQEGCWGSSRLILQLDEGPVHSPEAAGVRLAQDTVIGGRLRVKPEVGETLVGVRGGGGGGAFKSVVAGRRKEQG